MAPETSRLVRRLGFGLMLLAVCAVEIASEDTRRLAVSFSIAAGWIVPALLASCFIRPPDNPDERPPKFVFMLLPLLGVLPFFTEPFLRDFFGIGYAFELQLVFALRNLGLGLVVFGGWSLCLRAGCVVSLFLMLFAAAMTNHVAVLILLGLYTVVGSVWLMMVYWQGLRGTFIDAEQHVTVELKPTRERLPWISVGMVLTVLAGGAVVLSFGPERVGRTLGEWFPTSGGTGDYDPFSRGGINDGDDETKGDNARSTGMTQTDSFLDSPLPSLYDVQNDMYGEPFKPKEQERAIALDPKTKVRELPKTPADNLRPNREFPTTRNTPKTPRDPQDRAARAILEIEGPTPLHIRVAAYDRFDGRTWAEAPLVANKHQLLEKDEKSNWMLMIARTEQPIYAESVRHQFKITGDVGALVPTPPHVTRFRVGKVDQVDFFAWSHERILRMADRSTPSGIIVETEAKTIRPANLQDLMLDNQSRGEHRLYQALPPAMNPRIRTLAEEWTSGIPKGFRQIEAIIQRLQREYELDWMYRVPDDCTDTVSHFLLTAKRGPDYQFASAAAILLRSLGYPTRIVSGFYASPDHYDRSTKHTPIVREDIHFWPELMLPSGDWMVLEPTPGYTTLGPRLPFLERVQLALVRLAERAFDNIILLTSVLLGLLLLLRTQRRLRDRLSLLRRKWFPCRSWADEVKSTLALLERRARWSGRPRSPEQTPAAWLKTLPHNTAELTRLRILSEWACYAPAMTPPYSEAEIRTVCGGVLKQLDYPNGFHASPTTAGVSS